MPTEINKLPTSPGIYRMYHSATGESYIGSSINMRLRSRLHLTRIRAGRWIASHRIHNVFLGSTKSVRFEVLQLCTKADLLKREQAWMQKLGPVMNKLIASRGGAESSRARAFRPVRGVSDAHAPAHAS